MAPPNPTSEHRVPPEARTPASPAVWYRDPHEIVAGLVDPAEARRPYSGLDWIASLLGFAVAMFFLAVFLGIAAAALTATAGLRPDGGSLMAALSSPTTRVAAAAALVATLLAYLIGGYAAGRVARFSGVLNGFGVVLWTVIIAIGLGIAGVSLETLQFGAALNLHPGISLRQALTDAAVVAVPTLVLMAVGGLVGGAMGARYHRRVDRAVGVLS